MLLLFFFFFFFQAEDGIRDRRVTGVQTCALPISAADAAAHLRHGLGSGARLGGVPAISRGLQEPRPSQARPRSEERRVGKSVDLGGRRIIKKKKRRTTKRNTT